MWECVWSFRMSESFKMSVCMYVGYDGYGVRVCAGESLSVTRERVLVYMNPPPPDLVGHLSGIV